MWLDGFKIILLFNLFKCLSCFVTINLCNLLYIIIGEEVFNEFNWDIVDCSIDIELVSFKNCLGYFFLDSGYNLVLLLLFNIIGIRGEFIKIFW